MSEFGSRLRAARKYAKLTQVQLARASGIRQSSLSEAERSAEGSAYTPQLAKSCGVDPHWLATGLGEMIPARETSNLYVSPRRNPEAFNQRRAPEIMFSMAARPSAPREESPVDALPQIAASLQNLDAQIKALAPIFQDSGREVLRKWLSGTATASEAAAALQAMALASSAMGNQN